MKSARTLLFVVLSSILAFGFSAPASADGVEVKAELCEDNLGAGGWLVESCGTIAGAVVSGSFAGTFECRTTVSPTPPEPGGSISNVSGLPGVAAAASAFDRCELFTSGMVSVTDQTAAEPGHEAVFALPLATDNSAFRLCVEGYAVITDARILRTNPPGDADPVAPGFQCPTLPPIT